MPLLDTLRQHARHLKADVLTLYYALRHPGTPRWIKLLALLVVAYALSPIDLIPDFIPVLGLLDDLILLPLGIALVLRNLPPALLAQCREQARQNPHPLPTSPWGAALVITLWLTLASLTYLALT